MRIPKPAIPWLLLLLLLSGCAGSAAALPEQPGKDALSVSALFQAEDGESLRGSVAQFSPQEDSYPLSSGGAIRVQGLPRNGELVLTLFDRRQEVQGAMTLSFSEGAVMDATTGEDGIGHITVRRDTDGVALLFHVGENGALTCALWLDQAQGAETDVSQEGSAYGDVSAGH